MQVNDVCAHTIQEVLRMWDEHKDSLEPDKNQESIHVSECT